MSHIDRAQTKMLKRLNGAGMSKAGEDWLIAALDPYHDKALSLSGYPDGSRERSVVQVVKRDLDISLPTAMTLAPGETWDAHIFNMPNLQTERGFSGTSAGFWTTSSGLDALIKVGPGVLTGLEGPGNVNVVYVKTGTPSFCKDATFPGTGTTTPPLPAECYMVSTSPDIEIEQPSPTDLATLATTYTDGLHRVISTGYELSNVSKVLDMEGSITVYAQNARHTEGIGFQYNNITGDVIGLVRKVERMSGPPATADAALNLPGSRLWHSKYGAYIVPHLQASSLPYNAQTPQNFSWDGANPRPLGYGGVVGDDGTYASLRSPRNTGSGVSVARPALNRSFDFNHDQRGAYITQQGPDAKFKLTVRWIIESAHTENKPDLVTLQPPSPPLDILARAVYDECMYAAPVGVRLDENAFGEWFRQAAGRVLTAVKPMAQLAAPAAATALTGNPMAGVLVHEMIKGRPKKEKVEIVRETRKEERAQKQAMVNARFAERPRKSHKDVELFSEARNRGGKTKK